MYDYATGKSGPTQDPKKPINNSRNNTGLKELPPAHPAFIYYPYGVGTDFPSMGSGARTAMAGPVYYGDLYPAATRYPAYYNGKFFLYEWMRGYIKAVTLNDQNDFVRMEPFMGSHKWNSAIDIELGPDGRFYVLEYGKGWFSKNDDAGLSRIDYKK